jgi:tRNA threonylcarbamoyl adenosine modification protein YeaZ
MQDGQVVWEKVLAPSGENRQQAASLLIPAIDEACKEVQWKKDQIGALVVGQGPGSFTGVRTAVVTARSLAQALNLPLLGVCKLECVASCLPKPAAVVFSGAPQHYFVAGYEDGEHSLLAASLPPSYVNLSDLVLKLKPFQNWVADPPALETLSNSLPAGRNLPLIKNIAVEQAQIAWNRLSLKAKEMPGDDRVSQLAEEFPWHQVEPLYLRGASVTIKKTHGDSSKSHDPS